ncbi:MAG: RidA family protein [Alphaproteobacteria bacterium]
MSRVVVTPSDLPAIPSPISYAVVDDGRILVSGMLPVDDKWTVVAKGDMTAQAERTLDLTGTVLKAAGCSFEDVLKMNVYLVNARDYPAFNEVRRRYFRPPYPASTVVVVKELVVPDALIEIEVVARRR